MTPGSQFPDLAALADEIDPAPQPLPWWIRNSDLLGMAAVILIFLFAGHGVGEF